MTDREHAGGRVDQGAHTAPGQARRYDPPLGDQAVERALSFGKGPSTATGRPWAVTSNVTPSATLCR